MNNCGQWNATGIVSCGAGVILAELDDYLRERGFVAPLDLGHARPMLDAVQVGRGGADNRVALHRPIRSPASRCSLHSLPPNSGAAVTCPMVLVE